jgi:hypothetical protein
MKRAFAVFALTILVCVSHAFSQVNVTYDVAVTTASGPHAALFPSAERGTVSYTLDPAAVDSNADPSRGIFNNAVLAMSVSFPGIGISASAGSAGLAQTFDNVGANPCAISDQVFFFGGPILSASPLGGEAVNDIEVDFLSAFVAPPAVPGMLTGDALPLTRLPLTDAFIIFKTASGNTFVRFSPPPRDRVQAIVNRVETLVSIGILTRSQADRLRNRLDGAISALDRGNTRSACDNLRDFISRVNDLIDDGTLSRSAGDSMINSARDIREQLGC